VNYKKALTTGVLYVTAVLGVALCVGLTSAFAGSSDLNGLPNESPAASSAPKPTKGRVKCTAAINSDGSILSCKHCNPADTMQLSTGTYQVSFNKPCHNLLAVNGWSRWVQADTLSTGSEQAFCTTADRAGDTNAIWVECFDSTGADVDVSFFLFVAR
jgi:hypothetical protein